MADLAIGAPIPLRRPWTRPRPWPCSRRSGCCITLPSLVIWGAEDDILPPALADDALAALGTPAADKRKVILPRCGHNGHDQAPAAFAAAVREHTTRYR